jgi:hypothetical protein
MIYIQQGEFNRAIATCSRNKTLTGTVYYLWTIRHKLSNQAWQFIPYRNPSITTYPPSYDVFDIQVEFSQPENYLGTSPSDPVNLYLIPGEYYLKIYEQVSSTNLQPSLAYDVVYESTLVVKTDDPIEQIEYTGTSNTWVVYQG